MAAAVRLDYANPVTVLGAVNEKARKGAEIVLRADLTEIGWRYKPMRDRPNWKPLA